MPARALRLKRGQGLQARCSEAGQGLSAVAVMVRVC